MNGPPRTDIDPHLIAAQVIPRATYRLQLRREFNFQSVVRILPYLAGLGISHLYLSPIFHARPGSTYGYDVINHAAVNPELGTLEEFKELSALARSHGMGIILDIVPNHMAVMTGGNEWWLDVLENGPAAKFAGYFDIDWSPLRESMRNRLLVPVLENRYGDELNAGHIQVQFDASNGSFGARYRDHFFPLDPQYYPRIFPDAPMPCGTDFDGQEFSSIIDEFGRLPTRCETAPEQSGRRYRDKQVLKRRLAYLCKRNSKIRDCVEAAVAKLNGMAGKPESLDPLATLLNVQPYRLAYWKVAGDEINYRRFFDVNQLAALRAENPEVFEATHRLIIELLRERIIDGLRIDHVDGLRDPLQYLTRLREVTSFTGVPRCYIVVEKILAPHERLREEWPVDGTTGYEFNSLITNWLTSDRGVAQLDWTYRQFIRTTPDYSALVYESKKLLMRTSLAAEISVLGVQLDRIAQAHRDTADFTHFALRDALTEVIAAFPVYRTYIADAHPASEDIRSVAWAVGTARMRGKGSDRSIFDFIEDVLLSRSSVATDEARTQAILDFTLKFQQVTAPVTAKSVEDTAFYRYFKLTAANEVGGDPRTIGVSTAAFHRTTAERARRWAQSMLATSTHDSKRGEDVRFRLCALSEMPKQWRRFVAKVARLSRSNHVDLEHESAPSRNDEYLLLQTLLGVWPAQGEDDPDAIIARVKEYMIKAVREAKEKTSWIDPDHQYEAAVMEFVDGYVTKPRRSRFLAMLAEILEPVAFFGMLNAVIANVLKLTLPGTPDFYQGAELLELSLVDPDNRRVVDFERRTALLEKSQSMADMVAAPALLRDAIARWRYGEFKFHVIWRLLQLRREHVWLFAQSTYEPLDVHGLKAAHVCAFARSCQDTGLVVVVARWCATLADGAVAIPAGPKIWADTRVMLPHWMKHGSLHDELWQRPIADSAVSDGGEISATELFSDLPFAVLRWTRDFDS